MTTDTPTTQPLLDDVFIFNQNIVNIGDRASDGPQVLSESELAWLTMALKEEIEELTEAAEPEPNEPADLVGSIDALVDLCIFAIGGLYRMGLRPDQVEACFDVVMAANFQKKGGQKPSRAVGSIPDAIKPEGWVAPEQRIKEVLERG